MTAQSSRPTPGQTNGPAISAGTGSCAVDHRAVIRARPLTNADFLEIARAWDRARVCADVTRHPPVGVRPTASDFQVHWDEHLGLLVLDLECLGQAYRLFLMAWSGGIRCLSVHDSTFELMPLALDPGLGLLDRDNAWASFWRRDIPAAVLEALEPFATERWAMLCWASRSKAALELLQSAQVLLWILLMTARKEQWAEERIEACLTMKRRDILAACSLHPAQSTLKLLGKLKCAPYGQQAYELILPWLKDGERVLSFRHYPVVTLRQLLFLHRYPELASSPLVRDAPDGDWQCFDELAQWVSDTQRMRGQLDQPGQAQAWHQYRDQEALRREHDRLARRLNAAEFQESGDDADSDCPYPPPPRPGTESIVPITCFSELALEGRLQSHCVRSYHPRILAGQYYVYQVLQPERATLGLNLRAGSPPRIDQLKGYSNCRVSPETREAVHAWLDVEHNRENKSEGGPPIMGGDGDDIAGNEYLADTEDQDETGETDGAGHFERVDARFDPRGFRVLGIGARGGNAVRFMAERDEGDHEFAVVDCEAKTSLDPLRCSVIRQRNPSNKAPAESTSVALDVSNASKHPAALWVATSDIAILVTELTLRDVAIAEKAAHAAKAHEVLTMVLAIQPFAFEGREVQQEAEDAYRRLLPAADSIILISNERTIAKLTEDRQPGSLLDDVDRSCQEALFGITDILTRPGLIGVDLVDVITIAANSGKGLCSTAIASGEQRARRAAEKALGELASKTNLLSATGWQTTIAGGPDLDIGEFDIVGSVINDWAAEHANVLTGLSIRPELQDHVQVTVLVTGLHASELNTFRYLANS